MKNSALILFIAGFFLGASNIDVKALVESYPFFFGILYVLVILDMLLGIGTSILRARKAIKKKKLAEEFYQKVKIVRGEP